MYFKRLRYMHILCTFKKNSHVYRLSVSIAVRYWVFSMPLNLPSPYL